MDRRLAERRWARTNEMSAPEEKRAEGGDE